MKIRVLGASGAEIPGHNPPAYLINDFLLMDAGTITSILKEDEQWAIRYILISHAHLDHIKGIPFLADNILLKRKRHNVTLISTKEILKTIKDNLLNDNIWPDFTKIKRVNGSVIRLSIMNLKSKIKINSLTIRGFRVNHSVPAVGYRIEEIKRGRLRALVYSGDTGPTESLWSFADGADVLIVETSFPSRMESLAIKTGHLTPALLRKELKKIRQLPKHIYITHPKPQYLDIIKRELEAIDIPNIRLLKGGETINI